MRLMNWFSKCPFNRPTSGKTGTKSASFQAKNFCPLCESLSISCKGDTVIIAPIVLLNLLCCPSNIAWKITKRIINSINRMKRRWFFTDIFKKSIKIIYPFRINSNSSVFIPFKVFSIISETARLHFTPRLIFSRFRFSVSTPTVACSFFTEAPTAISIPSTKVSCTGDSNTSANTFAFPKQTKIFCMPDDFVDSKSSKSLTSKINKSSIAFRPPTTTDLSKTQVPGCTNSSISANTKAFPFCTSALSIYYSFNYSKISKYLSSKINELRHIVIVFSFWCNLNTEVDCCQGL